MSKARKIMQHAINVKPLLTVMSAGTLPRPAVYNVQYRASARFARFACESAQVKCYVHFDCERPVLIDSGIKVLHVFLLNLRTRIYYKEVAA